MGWVVFISKPPETECYIIVSKHLLTWLSTEESFVNLGTLDLIRSKKVAQEGVLGVWVEVVRGKAESSQGR